MTDELILWRRTFDERLQALEAGLAAPDSAALETLVLALARTAGEEADAAARDAVVTAQRRGETLLATAMADAQQAHAMLDGELARSAVLRAEIAELKEQLAAATAARQDLEAASRREIAVLTATVEQLQRRVEEQTRAAAHAADGVASATARAEAAIRERDALAGRGDALSAERERLAASVQSIGAERDTLLAERATLVAQRDALRAEHGALVAERDALVIERNALALERKAATQNHDDRKAERDRLMAERDAAVAERDRATAEHDALAGERDRVMGQHDSLAAERDRAVSDRDRLLEERADFVRTHDALILQRDTLVHERDDIVRERDRDMAKLRDELETARQALAEATQAKPPAAAPAAPATTKKTAVRPPAADGPIRKTDRQAFSNALGVQIDGEAALLVDLSVTGAQVLSCSALKPAKTVKMLLPSSESPVLCRGRIVWARLEPTSPGKPIRYRAGMFFTATDQAAVQSFIARHTR